MSNVLFLGIPSHGHVNPTLGLVSELVRRGEQVTYFSSEPFRPRIEATGAQFKCYAHDLDMFKAPSPAGPSPMLRLIASARDVIADILAQTQGLSFDYLVHSAPFPFAKPMAQKLAVPTVSSHAVFAGLEPFFDKQARPSTGLFAAAKQQSESLRQAAREVLETHAVHMPEQLLELLFNEGDLNLVYTSRHFAGELPHAGASYRFVGPPVFERQENTDFPLERLAGRRVLYISLGTVFGGGTLALFDTFVEAFDDWDGVVVMTAYGVDLSAKAVPDHFIVRDYVPQGAILAHTTAAITHGGMNSMSDLLAREIPFVCLPIGADQPALAARAVALGATIALDFKTVQAAQLRGAVARVTTEPGFRASLREIAASFQAAGGYPKAVDEIFQLKQARGFR